MSRSASAALMPLGDALGLLCATAGPVAERLVPLAFAGGRIAGGTFEAPRALPGGLTAARDGFAVDSAAIVGASPYAPVPLPHRPAWVEAGEALPTGTDAVLPPESLESHGAVADLAVREGARGPGEDLAAGDRLLAAGERIGPLHLLALAIAGLDAIPIRTPCLRLVATGAAAPDGLSPLLAALIAGRGGDSECLAVPDDVEAIASAVGGGDADAVFVLGGSGYGCTDRSVAGLARAGRLHAHGIALRPGETAAVGEAAGRPVLILPGRPEAALAAFLALGAPLLARLAGTVDAPAAPAPLLRKIASVIGLAEIVFVRRNPQGVEPLGGFELPLRRLLQADGFVLVAPEREGHPAGDQVEVRPL
ncbi:molybdopterin-binding protein [Methylobacterium radiodurans]|uniref:Molybdopterin molybdenumtransferase n=1 Tax=Methylobacterium radiodurans TaxID=2202828 RepID=A0A2U8W0M7_9HYPH|nr:molybdopterin-binding protein [Methylobacterium radiodurans]AWN39218.1 molybdopterin-binding protein [Methylobacterium radiodurans]